MPEMKTASPAVQQLFPIQIPLPFSRFKLPPNFILQCYRRQTWQFYLFVLTCMNPLTVNTKNRADLTTIL